MGYVDSIQQVLKADFSKKTAEEKEQTAEDVIMICSFACAGLVLQPVPGLEQGILPLQAGMVMALAHIFGQEVSKKKSSEILLDLASITGANIISRQIALTIAKILLPVFGGLLTAPYVFSVTWATGKAALHYVRSGGRDEARIRQIFQEEKAKSATHYSEDKAKASRPSERDIRL